MTVEGESMRGWVVLDEVASGEWGIGGKAITADDVKAIAAGVA
jgi:4-oxalocrotonate tautomerase